MLEIRPSGGVALPSFATRAGAATAADLDLLEAEIVAAREGSASLDAKLDIMEAATTTVASEVTTARGGSASLDARLDTMQAEVDTAETAIDAAEASIALKANIASPALTGTPTAPTPTAGDDSTRIATTAFVIDETRDPDNIGAAVLAGVSKVGFVPGDRIATLDSENSFALGDMTFASITASQSETAAQTIANKFVTPESLTALVADLVPITRKVEASGAARTTTSGLLSADVEIVVDIASEAATLAGAETEDVLTPERGRALARSITAETWPGYAGILFSEDVTGKSVTRGVLSFGQPVADTQFGWSLEVRGADIPASPGYVDVVAGDCPLSPSGKYKVCWRVRRGDDPIDPVSEGVELRLQNLNASSGSVSSIRFGETAGDGNVVAGGDAYAPTESDDPIDVTIVVSRLAAFDVDYVVPAGTRSISPYIRVYGSSGITHVGTIEVRPHDSVPEYLGDLEQAIADVEALGAQLAADAAAAEAAADAAEASLAGFTLVKQVALANALEFQVPDADVDDGQTYGKPYVTWRGSFLLGSQTTDGEAYGTNEPVLEIVHRNLAAGSGVPMQVIQLGPDSAASEPIILKRSRAEFLGDSVAALSGDAGITFQWQFDDGLDTANVAAVNIGGRAQSGATITPIAGNVLTYPGNFFVAVAPGDGANPIRTVTEWQSDGDVNVIVKNICMNNTAVINQSRWAKFAANLSDPRAAVADDAIYTLPIPGGATAIVSMIGTTVAATTPAVMFACRTDSGACEAMSVSATAEAAGNVLFATATGIVTDHTLYTDGKLTIVASNNGNVYVVNRLGASKTYGYRIHINGSTL